MLILFYALFIVAVAYTLYKVSHSYKIINPAIALTAVALLILTAPPPVKAMVVVICIVYGVSKLFVDGIEELNAK